MIYSTRMPYFLYQGVADPLGGNNTLWSLFGSSNQVLAAIALILATVVPFMKRERYAWTTLLPAGWLLILTLTIKLFRPDPKIGFVRNHPDRAPTVARGAYAVANSVQINSQRRERAKR